MKQHKLKSLAAVALASVMLVGVTACGGGESKTTDSASQPHNTEAAPKESEKQTEKQEESQPQGDASLLWEPFADTVEISIPVYDRGVEGVPNVSSNYWTEWIQQNFGDKYNVKVTFVPITRSDVMTDYALLASSESLPTILMEYDYPKLSQWANDGYLATYDLEAFKAVAPKYYARMEENGQLPYTQMNGETYFALALRPFYNAAFTFQNFVRMDWLEKVGYDHVPRNHKEYMDAMRKIKEAGIAEYPGGGEMVTGRGSDQNYQYRTYPYDELDWAMYGDVNIPALGHYANKELLRRENEKYNAGILNPEYYITDNETAKAQFINGKTYQFGAYISPNMEFLTAFYEHNPDAKLAIVPVYEDTQDDKTTPAWRADNPFGMIIGFSSFASEQQIEAAWRYMEWMTQEENLFAMQWGVEGENYTLDKNNLPVSVSDYNGEYKQGYNNNKDYWCVTIESRNAGDVDDIMRSNLPQDLPQNFNNDVKQFYETRTKLAKKGYAINDALFSVVIEAETEYSGTLMETYKEYRDRLTMCKPEEFDALYDQLAKEYAEAGFAEIAQQRKEAYEAGHSTKLPDVAKKK